MRETISMALCLVALLTLVGACEKSIVMVGDIKVSMRDVKSGKTADVWVDIDNPGGLVLQIEWGAKRGGVSSSSESPATGIYTAPLEPGPDTITIKVMSDNKVFASKSAPINVERSEPEAIIISAYDKWAFETYKDTQGISNVKPEGDVLCLTADLTGGHDNFSKGEAYLELSSIDIPALGRAPVNMKDKEVKVQAKVRGEFRRYDGSAPPGFQLFLKSGNEADRYYYGPWENVPGRTDGDWIIVSLETDKDALEDALRNVALHDRISRDFDVTKVVRIGLKFAMGDGSETEYSGELYMGYVVITSIEGR